MRILMTIKKQPLAKLVVLTASTLVVAGCFGTPSHNPQPAIFNNPIQISESIERLELYSRPNGMELSARDQDAVANFIEAYQQFGDGPLYINMPAMAHSGLGAQQAAGIVRQAATQYGVGHAIQSGQYQHRPGAPAPVVVSYRRLKSVPQNCRFQGDLTSTDLNVPSSNWGCAYHANLAAMIQDPRQLLEPYATGPSNAQRRLMVHDKYIEGQETSAAFPSRQYVNAEGG